MSSRPIFKSAPSVNSIAEIVGTRREVLAVLVIQRAWRRYIARGIHKLVINKPTPDVTLGVVFSPEWRARSVLASVRPGMPASGLLHQGDIVISVNGEICRDPVHTVKRLRESIGDVTIRVQPCHRVDLETLGAEEMAAVDAWIASSTLHTDSVGESRDECAVCFGLLCEPVRFPSAAGYGCTHLFCRPCVRQWMTRKGDNAACPLCRAPMAGDPSTAVKVDAAAAKRIESRHAKEYAECLALHRALSLELEVEPA